LTRRILGGIGHDFLLQSIPLPKFVVTTSVALLQTSAHGSKTGAWKNEKASM
jgi:hypothetical protein